MSSSSSSTTNSSPKAKSWLVAAHDSGSVTVTEDNWMDIKSRVPTCAVGDKLMVSVDATTKGQVVSASVHVTKAGVTDAAPLDPRSACHLIKEVPGFLIEGLRHLSLRETEAIFPSAAKKVSNEEPAAKSAVALDVTDAPSAASAETKADPSAGRVSVAQNNDQFLLQKLEDFVESDSFTTTVRGFAGEHAHKFKPQTSDEEHPLHYQELYLQYEKLVEAALEAFLKEQSSSVGALVGCVKRAQERGEPLACIDHLLATSDYPAFLELMLDYKFDMHAMGRRSRRRRL